MRTKTKSKRVQKPIKSWNDVEIVPIHNEEYHVWSLCYKEGKIPRGKSSSIASISLEKEYGILEEFNLSKGYQSLDKMILQKLLETALNELGEICIDYHSQDYDDREWWQKFAEKRRHTTNFWSGILTIH